MKNAQIQNMDDMAMGPFFCGRHKPEPVRLLSHAKITCEVCPVSQLVPGSDGLLFSFLVISPMPQDSQHVIEMMLCSCRGFSTILPIRFRIASNTKVLVGRERL